MKRDMDLSNSFQKTKYWVLWIKFIICKIYVLNLSSELENKNNDKNKYEVSCNKFW